MTGGQGETFKQEYGWINIRLPVGALLNDDDPVIIMTNAPRIMGSSAPSRGVCGA